ncbi:MAG: hypothetical protein E7352_03765 [Clostridiales bacterium]|nr:hypothetical protein [Clostridiales bacterium]
MKGGKEEKIGEALLKVALGYQIAEVTEEYAEVDGALKLTKRKKTKKDVPPDLKAVQMLLEGNGGEEYSGWSDEELEREKARLLQALGMGLQTGLQTGEQTQTAGDVIAVKTKTPKKVGTATAKKSVQKKTVSKKSVAKKTVKKKTEK